MVDAELERTLDGVRMSHAGLLAWLDELVERGAVDAAVPSRLPDWSVGHVLTHLARNADGMIVAVEAAARGKIGRRYPGGVAQRDHDIATGAPRAAAEQVADVRATVERLDAAWRDVAAWDAPVQESSDRVVPLSELVVLRWREVEVHRVDLGLGYEPDEWPALFVRRELRWMEMRWRATKPMGLTTLPAAALATPPPTRLAWLYGRVDIAGLAPAGVF